MPYVSRSSSGRRSNVRSAATRSMPGRYASTSAADAKPRTAVWPFSRNSWITSGASSNAELSEGRSSVRPIIGPQPRTHCPPLVPDGSWVTVRGWRSATSWSRPWRSAASGTTSPGATAGVLVGDDGATAAWGVTNVEFPMPVSPASLFQVGSISKTFTSAAVMLLVQEGRLALEDPVARHLPELGPATGLDFEAITVELALSHQAGFDGDHLFVRARVGRPHGAAGRAACSRRAPATRTTTPASRSRARSSPRSPASRSSPSPVTGCCARSG